MSNAILSTVSISTLVHTNRSLTLYPTNELLQLANYDSLELPTLRERLYECAQFY